MKGTKQRAGVRAIYIALLILVLGSACRHMRFPEPTAPKEAETKQTPAEAPTESWSELAAQGRAAFRANDLPESERAYIASLDATSKFESSDVRVTTAIDNLARLASYYQGTDEREKAQALVKILAENAQEGRKGDFETAGLPMTAEAERLAEDEDFESAADLYTLSLSLIGVGKRINRPARIAAQWDLMQIYIDTSQIAKAETELNSIQEEILERFGPDSTQSVGLLIPTAQIQIANGQTGVAEETYRKVLESDLASSEQQALALQLYTEALEGLDRKEDAARLQAEFKTLGETQ